MPKKQNVEPTPTEASNVTISQPVVPESKPIKPKAKKPAVQVIVKEVKKKRPLSEYNKFISENTKGAKMTFIQAIAAWKSRAQS